MGLHVNRNDKNEFQLMSTITGKPWHEKEWLTEDEAKRTLINIAFNDFVEQALKIDMEFPRGYYVNDERCMDDKPFFSEWVIKAYKSDDAERIIEKQFEEMYDRLKLTFKI